jgi:predicted AAA+ superfamily ATPase
MPKPISERHRWEIVFLHLHPYGPQWNIQQISKYLHLGRHTVSHWIEVYQQTKSIEARKSNREEKNYKARKRMK